VRSADRPRIFTCRLPICTSIAHTGAGIGMLLLIASDATVGSGARSTHAGSPRETVGPSRLLAVES